MMRQYELVERVTSYDPHADEALLNRAYVYAMKAHGSQQRASGDPYFSHPLEVAGILTDLKLDDATIATALLHDTIEDTQATREEIDEVFGPEIGQLVEGLTKIGRLDLVSKQAEQAENFRKLLLAVSDDIRVLLVKLADRLHNMRTIDHVGPEKQLRIAQETMDIYAPLAGRMGIQSMRDELEDLAFAVINPQARSTIMKRLDKLRREAVPAVETIKQELTAKLKQAGIDNSVSGREKRPYSIWQKMERKSISLEQLSDILGFRVITRSLEDCYRVLGVVHQSWPVVPGRFKDYISTPKQNDYRSIHTTVIGPENQRVELQIRTGDMHEVAERGVAAHSFYKDPVTGEAGIGQAEESNAYKWLRRLIDMLEEGDSPEEFLEHTRLELFQDQVFCFTPAGTLIALPRGANPIDFAYAVHTDVGNSCVGCKINGRAAPLMSELKNGDEVEVIRTDGRTPPAAWERIVVTGKARGAIRRATREAVRRQYATLGREIVERALQHEGLASDDEALARALPHLALASVDDLLAKAGRGELASELVIKALQEAKPEDKPASGRRRKSSTVSTKRTKSRRKPPVKTNGAAKALPIRGINADLPVRFAEGCGPVPGDRIVGILTRGEGITIYPIHADILREFDNEPERWVDVAWDIDASRRERFVARIRVSCRNEVGALAGITQTIGDQDANIENLVMARRSSDFYEMDIDVGVWDLIHLGGIISSIRQLPVIHEVQRAAA
ncbi:MAG: bifunctional (p)ppGpp synthetase/guanosine-3',5'-bis(diphosphate) 3'-pyrophosphohydrolase [Rhizobiales bacterium]|nr:bifunctional (p)ppGpp synthetase/guanosine-3',5'-bis(diphosphate) 3'-pyrophosphohydrolase [Hyphomicrobiales bacterium]